MNRDRVDPVASFRQRLEKKGETLFADPEQKHLKAVYHYSNWDAVQNILTSRRMRATHHLDQDDRQELRAAETTIDRIAADLIALNKGTAKELIQQFGTLYRQRRAADTVKAVYLTCFTTRRDDELLWKNYANDVGACIAFQMVQDELLPDTYEGTKLARAFGRVIYDEAALGARIRRGFEDVLSELVRTIRRNSLPINVANAMKDEALLQLAVVAATSATLSKGSEYAFEAEWRSTAIPDPDGPEPKPNVFHRANRERRFLPLEYRANGKRFALAELIVRGPDPDAARSKAREILLSAGYADDMPPIVVSQHSGC